MKRSFISLTPQEALHVAVFIEERNAEVYHRFAEMFVEFRDVQSLEIASVFWDMAAEDAPPQHAAPAALHGALRQCILRADGR